MTASILVTLPALTVLTLAVAHTPALSQTPQQSPARIDSAAMLAHVRVLSHDSLGGRSTGTEGNLKARTYLTREFERIGLEKIGAAYGHTFTLRQRDTTAAPVQGLNLVGMVRGRQNPARYMVVTAHYDHLPPRNGEVFNGADDNASGTGALLAMAAYLKRNPPAHSVIFVAFDAEERGLQGAGAFVANPPVPVDSIVMNINMDMVGRNDAGELYVTGTMHYPFLKPYIEQVQPRARVKLLMGHDVAGPGKPSSDNWTGASDHGQFHNQKIPFLYFGVEDHPDYHRATDEFERLQPAFYVRAIETVLDAVLLLDANLGAIAAARK